MVPPNSQMYLPVKMTIVHRSASRVVVVEPCEEFVHAYGLLVVHSITDAVTDHTKSEPCFAPVTVHENVRVGMLHSIVDCAQVQPVSKLLDLSRPSRLLLIR